jgi:hypothetical protein
MNKAMLLKVAALAIAASTMCAPAHAIFRAYLAIDGNDANACTLVAPCRLLPAAMAAVDAGGEIWMLDSANYNTGPVAVTKSVSILAVPGVVGSVVATGGGGNNGLNIATAGVKVSLRNLVFVMLTAGAYGVAYTAGDELTIQDCEFANFGLMGGGLFANAANGKVTVVDTTVRNSPTGINLSGGVRAVLERVRVLNNMRGVDVSNSRLAMTDSVVAGNTQVGINVFAGSGQSYAALSNSEVTNNATGIKLESFSTGDSSTMMVSGSRFSHHTTSAIHLYKGASSGTEISLDANVFAANASVISTAGTVGSSLILSRGNNTLRLNVGSDSLAGHPSTSYIAMTPS